MMMLWFLGLSCSEYDLQERPPEPQGSGDSEAAPPEDSELPETDSEPAWEACLLEDEDPRELGLTDRCEYGIGDFQPVVKWTAGAGRFSTAAVAVGDLNGDGIPEIAANFTGVLGMVGGGDLVILQGSDGSILWEADAQMGYASTPAIADLDADGSPEIVAVREYQSGLVQEGDYTVLLYAADGSLVWESEHFTGDDMDYEAGPSVSDMDHDGSPEIIVGRVILNADGSTRGVGAYGRGSWGIMLGGISEGSLSAVADVDLDGVEEVVVGNALYRPDGSIVNADPTADDGMVSVANLDEDPEAEILVSTFDTVRALDTDLSVLWGPIRLDGANIASPTSVDDLDGDGWPEIVVAGGNAIYVLNHDGTELWRSTVQDESGSSGASIFDFEGDGWLEVVYIDEIQLVAYSGVDGTIKFQSQDHSSSTLVEYPVIADVDADGHAEIVVPDQGGYALRVYQDASDSWAPTRKVWNQHAYAINHIHDNLTVPVEATPSFSDHNSWRSASRIVDEGGLSDDLEAEILDVCCDGEAAGVLGRVLNRSARAISAGIPVSLYGKTSNGQDYLGTVYTTEEIPSGSTGESLEFSFSASLMEDVIDLWMVVDDDGSGGGILGECSEENNGILESGPFCP